MMESPAYRVLSLSARRVLDRIMIELAHHGGNDNGKLPVTYEHFEEYGIHRHAIAPAIRELERARPIRRMNGAAFQIWKRRKRWRGLPDEPKNKTPVVETITVPVAETITVRAIPRWWKPPLLSQCGKPPLPLYLGYYPPRQ
jgi:hypothetical protein